MVSPVKRTWSRRGQTPTFRTRIDHHDRLSLFGILLVSTTGKKIRLSIKSYWDTLTGEKVIIFLEQVLRLVRGHLVLVWDRHPIHRRALVKQFIASKKRLHVFEFPVAAPELNPAEYIWSQTKEYTAGIAPHNKDELRANVLAGISRTRVSQKRLSACLRNSKVPWFD